MGDKSTEWTHEAPDGMCMVCRECPARLTRGTQDFYMDDPDLASVEIVCVGCGTHQWAHPSEIRIREFPAARGETEAP